jgi:hypothetical protein
MQRSMAAPATPVMPMRTAQTCPLLPLGLPVPAGQAILEMVPLAAAQVSFHDSLQQPNTVLKVLRSYKN